MFGDSRPTQSLAHLMTFPDGLGEDREGPEGESSPV